MRVNRIRVISRFVLEVSFDDGSSGELDLGKYAGKGVFRAWDQPGNFERVTIGSGGELSWECGVDLCADSLYLDVTGKSPGEVFPGLEPENRCA